MSAKLKQVIEQLVKAQQTINKQQKEIERLRELLMQKIIKDNE
jgi:hypothetical protein